MNDVKSQKEGMLIISLDFELYWGMFDKVSLEEYRENLEGVYVAIPKILEIFKRYDIHATWAIVGFLFYDGLIDLKKSLPFEKPNYSNPENNSYIYINKNFENINMNNSLHFSRSLIEKIKKTPSQEIGSHTFSHFYCLEDGQNEFSFTKDIETTIQTFNENGLTCKSVVFPRNQINKEYLKICNNYGITSYRGTEPNFIYKAKNEIEKNNKLKRILRFLDSYLNLFGHNTFSLTNVTKNIPINVPSSRFLRPYSKSLKAFEKYKVNRIKKDMEYAARNGNAYHIWWHPHNFGKNVEENLNNLIEILDQFLYLKEKYNMKSANMSEVSQKVMEEIRIESGF
ncbi:hypothetical protein ABE41_018275 [Fictibacillus arsenicus]|uniref:NodB homology domain-containing protein n=1 Tax=Fictibacillus arsenicus TaxID=255247 RepID=A0A1B1Z944_9BACL|nr:polysaccharide deacetylase family protein [Fictibacillus arsenicus]ANX13963.1 hypothetical protein ABE41_018275 [Fictibacillus arsenicus]